MSPPESILAHISEQLRNRRYLDGSPFAVYDNDDYDLILKVQNHYEQLGYNVDLTQQKPPHKRHAMLIYPKKEPNTITLKCDRCDSSLNVNCVKVCAQCLEELIHSQAKNLPDAKRDLIRYIREISMGLLLRLTQDDNLDDCLSSSPWMRLIVRYNSTPSSERGWLLSIQNPKTKDMKYKDMKYKDSDVDPVQLFKRTIQRLES